VQSCNTVILRLHFVLLERAVWKEGAKTRDQRDAGMQWDCSEIIFQPRFTSSLHRISAATALAGGSLTLSPVLTPPPPWKSPASAGTMPTSGFNQADYPTLFGRFNSSPVAHGAPIVRPKLSEQLN
jgi:hypothetical protein